MTLLTVSDRPLPVPSERLFMAAFFILLVTFLMLTQNDKAGFEPGHHGWVTAHLLAIAQHAYAENGLVGYAVQSIDDDGAVALHYFDRYPILFVAMLRGLIELSDHPASQIQLARQFMNLICALNIVVAYGVLRTLGAARPVALGAALFAFSGYYFAYYRDMVHVDQPAVLGLSLTAYGIALSRRSNRIAPAFAFATVALLLGRAYPSMFLLAAWWVIDTVFRLWDLPKSVRMVSAVTWQSMSFRLAVWGVVVCTAVLLYNVSMESRARGVSIAETSIVQSALRRLGAEPSFTARERSTPLTWTEHARTQTQRVVVGAVPYPFGPVEGYRTAVEYLVKRAGVAPSTLLFLTALGLAAAFVRRQDPCSRPVWLLILLGGFAWMIPMKNLAIPHEYTTIYHLGFYLVVYASLISTLTGRGRPIAAVMAASVFVGATLSANEYHQQLADRVGRSTQDFANIRSVLPPGAVVSLHAPGAVTLDGTVGIIQGSPYAAAFFLPDQYFSTTDRRIQYVVAARTAKWCPPQEVCELLTPQNQEIDVYRIRRGAQ